MDNGTHYTTLYESRAHIFQVDPETNNSWIQKGGESAIPIAFVASIVDQHQDQHNREAPCKRELKLIGTNEEGENILDANIMPKTTFAKRSQKFGQWTDHTGQVYGLGFNSEYELTDFIVTFQQLQREILFQPESQPQPVNNNAGSQPTELLQQQQQAPLQPQRAHIARGNRPDWYQQNGNNNNNISETTDLRYGPSSSRASTVSSGTQQFSSNTLAHPGHQIKRQPIQALRSTNGGDSSLNNSNNVNNDGVDGLSNVSAYPRSQSMFGLQSGRASHNNNSAGKNTPDEEASPVSQQNDWQIKDQLKYENERLKQALEESSKNAIIWHSELLNLRTNNVKLTQALQESKAHVDQWERELFSLRDENKDLLLKLKALESIGDPEKAREVQRYKNHMEEIQHELRKKENEIEELQKSMEELELKQSYNSNDGQAHEESPVSLQKLDVINAKLEAKINDLVNVQREFSQLIETKSHH